MQRETIKDMIKHKAAAVLCLETTEIQDDRRLSDLGMDSIIGVELISTLNRTFKVELKKSVLYDYPTLNRLSDYLFTMISGEAPGGSSVHAAPPETPQTGLLESPSSQSTGTAPTTPRIKLKTQRETSITPAPHPQPVSAHSSAHPSAPPPGWEENRRRLEAHFGQLPPDLFSRYRTIPEMAAYLARNHREKLVSLTAEAKKEPGAKPKTTAAPLRVKDEDIAIIGISGRYPRAGNLETFWENLKAGKNCITEIPAERWDYRDYYEPGTDKPGKTACKWGGFIDEVEMFDPLFFNISPREAITMDPQTRLLLESVWHTLEDAGYTRRELGQLQHAPHGRVGLFIGCMYQQYPLLAGASELCAALSNSSYWSMVNRCSYFFDFKGPSIAVDTACSSSLTAVHIACESLRRGECAMAIAGGVNLNLHPSKYNVLNNIGLIGSEGKSCSLGQANGYIPGEGVGTVLLRPLSAARQEGDRIYAVIKGSDVNHSGGSDGFTLPNPAVQADLIASVLEKTGISPDTIGNMEVSATGSPMGDKAEVEALVDAFRRHTGAEHFCALGSVKANIGHLEAAAGISQLTRVVLQLKHKTLVPSINATPLNPGIHLDNSPFYVQEECGEWKPFQTETGDAPGTLPRRAGINSFGAGGSNAHLILEEYLEPTPSTPSPQTLTGDQHLIVLSARDEESLKTYAARIAALLTPGNAQGETTGRGDIPPGNLNLEDIAYTLQVGREAMAERLALIVSTTAELAQRLTDFCQDRPLSENFYRGKVNEGKDKAELLIDGEAGQEFIRLILKNKELHKLARLWVWGVEVQWKLLYPGPLPRRISLPLYPFKKKRCWLETIPTEPAQYTHPTPLAQPNPPRGAAGIKSTLFTGKDSASGTTGTTGTTTALFIHEKVRENLAEVLRLEDQEIDENRRFLELGMDSLLGVEFIKKLNETFHLNLKATVLYDYSTVKVMSRYLQGLVTTGGTEPGKPVSVSRNIRDSRDRVCKGLVIRGVGEIAGVEWQEVAVPEPGEHQVQIRVKASALNFADLLCIRGLYPTMPDYPFVAGFQVSGLVESTGKGVTRYKVGDEVVAMMGADLGGHAEIVTVPESLVQPKLGHIGFADSCGWPDAFVTAYYCLYEIGKLKNREHVLIQCAAGGVGLMAVQLAKLKNAVIYGTSSSPQKLEYLAGIGVDYTINYAEEDVAARIKELSGGRGVDIVLNTLPGDALQQGIRSLAPGGRYLEIAVAGLKASRAVDLSYMTDNQSFHSIDLRKLWLNQPQLGSYLQRMTEMIREGTIRPIVTRTYPAEQAQEALEYIARRKSIGKVVLTYPENNVPWNHTGKESQSRPLPDQAAADIAVIGMSGRFPGAANIREFWDNLARGSAGIDEVPADRWDFNLYYDPNPETPNKTNCQWGGFLADIDKFDPMFFNISPMEAEQMDPQQRLFLEEAWKAIEDAGYAAESLAGQKCGVFVGVGTGDYARHTLTPANNPNAFSLMGASNSILSGRVSYLLDLTGPNIAVDTACSSSLTALHLGCQSILNGESDLVIAGGVNVMTTPILHIMTGKAGMLSKEGKCKTFDNDADGFVPGEAVAAVILKPLAKALADNDHIYGVIKGTGLNQDGQTNGITAPSAKSQVKLVTELYDRIRIRPEHILYVEAHGTGTKLGDPIEIDALTTAFKRYTAKTQYCAVGSVKTNIGHGLAAAGISGLVKVCLSLEHKKLVPSLNFQAPNEHIDFRDSPFYVNTQFKEWERVENRPLQAVVSSFGFSGTNAHVVVEEAPPVPDRQKPASARPYYLVALSAKTETALISRLADLHEWLNAETNHHTLADISFTLLTGRNHFPVRLAIVARDSADLARQVKELTKNGISGYELRGDGKTRPPKTGTVPNYAGEDIIARLHENRNPADDEYKQNLTVLASLYIKGHHIDWNQLFAGSAGARGEGARIPMPTYPFARERYWLAETPEHAEHGGHTNYRETSGQPLHTGTPTSPGQASPPQSQPINPVTTETGILRQLQSELIQWIVKILKVKEEYIYPEGAMLEYGFDSITLTEFVRQVNAQYRIEMTLEAFFDLNPPTVETLSTYLYHHFKDSITTYFRGSNPNPSGHEDSEIQAEAKTIKTLSAGEIRAKLEEDVLQMASSHLSMGRDGYDQDGVAAFLRQLNQTFNLDITLEVFSSQPSPGAFIKYLGRTYKEAVNRYYQETAADSNPVDMSPGQEVEAVEVVEAETGTETRVPIKEKNTGKRRRKQNHRR